MPHASWNLDLFFGKILNKLAPIIAAACILSSVLFSSSALSQTSTTIQPYFKEYSSDVTPIRANSCGGNYENKGWTARDFGGGISGKVGITYEARKPLTVTLLFLRFSDEKYGKLEIFPEEIKLYIFPGDRVVNPSSIERKPFNPDGKHCAFLQQGELITLKFPVQPEQVEQVALIFPSGTVSKGDPINVAPFRFDRITYSPDGTPSASRPPVSLPVLPPVSPRFGYFESAIPMPSNVKGAWIVDAKATEDLVAKIPSPPHADKLAEWFGLASGWMALFTYEFEGNKAKASAYRGNKVFEYERISNQDRETTYALIGATNSKTPTLSVSMLKHGNIRIVPSDNPGMAYLRWKPGQLKSETTTPDDLMAASRVWLISVQAIVNTLKTPPSPPK